MQNRLVFQNAVKGYDGSNPTLSATFPRSRSVVHWETLRKYDSLLKNRLLPWCATEGHSRLRHSTSRSFGSSARREQTARATRQETSNGSARFSVSVIPQGV